MQSALLTGANGFLGKEILKVLKDSFEVKTLGLNPENDYITDLAKTDPIFTQSFDLVVHCAAVLPGQNGKNSNDFLHVNEDGTRRICEALDRTEKYPQQFVFISTVAVYGAISGENITEDAPLNGYTPYAKSKLAAEKIIIDWCRSHSVTSTILRLPLVAGENAKGNIAAMIKAIHKHRFFLIGSGSARKSMVLAADVAAFIPKIASFGGIYNLTDGEHPSFNDFAAVVSRQLNKKAPPHLPLWICRLLAAAGNVFGAKFPFNRKVLLQLTSSLTFNDDRARKTAGWNPRPVL